MTLRPAFRLTPALSFGALLALLGSTALGTACSSGNSGGNNGGSAGSGGIDGGAGSGGSAGSAGTDASAGSGGAGGIAGGGGTGGGDAGPSTGTGVCKVSKTGKSGLLLKGTVLAPGQIISAGQVLVNSSGIVTCVAKDCSTTAGAADASVVDCTDGVISPGLINPHDHITYANNKPHNGTTRYEHRNDWRKGTHGGVKISYKSGASKNEVLAHELRMVMSGATSTVSAGGERGLLRNLDVANLKEGLPVQTVDSDTFPLADSSGTLITNGCAYSSSRTSAADIAGLDSYVPHIGEGIDLAAENELVCTGQSGPYDLIEPQTGIVHAVAANLKEAKRIEQTHTWVVWSPRTNISLYGNTAPIVLLDNEGVGMALGTDWIVSGSMNMSRELRCADDLNQKYFGKHFSDKQLWEMATTNGAFVTGTESGLGMLKPGYMADIAVFDGTKNKGYRAVIDAGPADVALVLRGGTPLYGDDALVTNAALGGATCEPLAVCGVSKAACVKADTGVALADVKAAGEAIYPLANCGGNAPPSEPSCVPLRPNEYDGSITATDDDGDGIPNGSDNCPDVFNPIRPMDIGAQPDTDGDGEGDACDPCPDDKTDSCTKPDAEDIDGDGIPNGVDNCPGTANPNQTDTDKDGKGDACDSCSSSNPGFATCPLPLTSVRDPNSPQHPSTGSAVTIQGVYVTGVVPQNAAGTGKSLGFYVEDGSQKPFSGIYIFTKTVVPTVKVGNKVDITGVYDPYQSLDEISSPTYTVTDSGTTLPFSPLVVANPADLATGGALADGYQSMLVEVDNVKVTVLNPDAPSDYDEFAVTGNLRVDDQLYPPLNNAYPVGTAFTKIIGVSSFAFANNKIEPRTATDLQP